VGIAPVPSRSGSTTLNESAGPIRILLVEDNRGDALLAETMLDDRYPGQYATTVAVTLGAARSVLDQQIFDAVLLDLSLPDSHGPETIGQLASSAPDLPIIVITGAADERIAMEAVRLGAQDYLVKGQADGAMIARAIRYAIDRKQTETSLRAQWQELEVKNEELQEIQRRVEAYRDRYIDLYDFAPLGYVTLDEDGYIQEINMAGARLLDADR
jgi:DNA-binding NtrC family response regulator